MSLFGIEIIHAASGAVIEGQQDVDKQFSYVALAHETAYKLKLRNKDPKRRCDAVLKIDNKDMGKFRIDASSSMIIERPQNVAKQFVFIEEKSEEARQTGLQSGKKENGLVSVTFSLATQQYEDDAAEEVRKQERLKIQRRIELDSHVRECSDSGTKWRSKKAMQGLRKAMQGGVQSAEKHCGTSFGGRSFVPARSEFTGADRSGGYGGYGGDRSGGYGGDRSGGYRGDRSGGGRSGDRGSRGATALEECDECEDGDSDRYPPAPRASPATPASSAGPAGAGASSRGASLFFIVSSECPAGASEKNLKGAAPSGADNREYDADDGLEGFTLFDDVDSAPTDAKDAKVTTQASSAPVSSNVSVSADNTNSNATVATNNGNNDANEIKSATASSEPAKPDWSKLSSGATVLGGVSEQTFQTLSSLKPHEIALSHTMHVRLVVTKEPRISKYASLDSVQPVTSDPVPPRID